MTSAAASPAAFRSVPRRECRPGYPTEEDLVSQDDALQPLSPEEFAAETGAALPDKEVISLLDLNADLDIALDAAAPIDLAVAANANVAAPIDAAVGANVLSRRLDRPGAGRPGRAHRPGDHRRGRSPTRRRTAPSTRPPSHGHDRSRPPTDPADGGTDVGGCAHRDPAACWTATCSTSTSTSPRTSNLAAPIDGAVAANANVAAPIDAAVAANIGSVDSDGDRGRPAGRDHHPDHRRRRQRRRPTSSPRSTSEPADR